MKVKLTAHIHHQQWSWEKEGQFIIYSGKLENCEHRTYICEQQIEIDVPDNYDPRPAQIAALIAHKQTIMADYQKSVDDINEKISKLQALEYTA